MSRAITRLFSGGFPFVFHLISCIFSLLALNILTHQAASCRRAELRVSPLISRKSFVYFPVISRLCPFPVCNFPTPDCERAARYAFYRLFSGYFPVISGSFPLLICKFPTRQIVMCSAPCFSRLFKGYCCIFPAYFPCIFPSH